MNDARSQAVAGQVKAIFDRYPRSCWVLIIVGLAIPLYFPINAYTDRSQAAALDFSWDHAMPFSMPWIYIYTLVYVSAFFPLLVVKSGKLVQRMALAFLSSFLLAYVFFLAFPVTTVPMTGESFRPLIKNLDDSTFTGWLVCLNFFLDPPNNCFPSLHIAMAFVAAYATYKADPIYGAIVTIFAVLIALSTLLVKQHYLADVVAGMVLAFLTSYVFLRPYRAESENPLDIRFRRIYAGLFIPLWLVAFSICQVLYHSGFRPWRS
jgi:membrane-associated phospholipid phosphatase